MPCILVKLNDYYIFLQYCPSNNIDEYNLTLLLKSFPILLLFIVAALDRTTDEDSSVTNTIPTDRILSVLFFHQNLPFKY